MTGVGDLDVLDVVDISQPKVPAGNTLVKVIYCGVNHLDTLIRSGKRPGPKTFPHILGSEIVGELESGEKVAVYPWTFCGECEQCSSGNENICDNSGTIGRTTWGGYAEYANVPSKNLIALPEDADLEKYCALALAGTTAFHLVDRAQIEKGQTVLVTGASGGVGNIVVQLLKHKGCTVIGATSHREKERSLREMGVDHVVAVEHMVEEVKKVIPGGVHAVVDTVGGRVWSFAVEAMGKNSTMTFCATSLDDMGQVHIGSAFSRQLNIRGSYGGTVNDTKRIFTMQKNDVIKPIIDGVFALEDVREAHRKVDMQQLVGKILLKAC